MLDRQIRGLIEYDFVHRKISNAGKIGAVLGFLSRGNMFVCIKKWYPMKQTVDSNFFWAKKSVYELYDSYNHFELIDEKANKKEVQRMRRMSGV